MRSLDALNWFCWGGTISLWLVVLLRMIHTMRSEHRTDRAHHRHRTDRKRRK